MRKTRNILVQLGKSLPIVIGLVLVWRGIWYVMDWVDARYLAGDHLLTALAGIVAGLLLLYLPDGDLKEIEKL